MSDDDSERVLYDRREGICHHCNKPLDYDPFDGTWIPRKKDGTLNRTYSQNFDRIKRMKDQRQFLHEWREQTNP